MEVKAINWIDNYAAMFKPIGTPQAHAWVVFLKANVNGDDLDVEEINEAVAKLCQEWQGGAKRYPGVQDIFFKILELRRAKRALEEGPDDEHRDECGMCFDGQQNTGWVMAYFGIYQDNGAAVPCLCVVGDKWRDMCYQPRDHSRLKDLARLGVRERKRRMDEREAEGQAMLDSGLKLSTVVQTVKRKMRNDMFSNIRDTQQAKTRKPRGV